MNAVIALCHFCEVHGPCPIFCTHTLRDLKIDEITSNAETANEHCPGCSSIGKTTGMLSEDTESNANFLSTQTSILVDVVSLVKQAAVRSLSCEVIHFIEITGNRHDSLILPTPCCSVNWQHRRKSCLFWRRNPWPRPQLHISNTRFTSAGLLSPLFGCRTDEGQIVFAERSALPCRTFAKTID